jgi:hypothetical protein
VSTIAIHALSHAFYGLIDGTYACRCTSLVPNRSGLPPVSRLMSHSETRPAARELTFARQEASTPLR